MERTHEEIIQKIEIVVIPFYGNWAGFVASSFRMKKRRFRGTIGFRAVDQKNLGDEDTWSNLE